MNQAGDHRPAPFCESPCVARKRKPRFGAVACCPGCFAALTFRHRRRSESVPGRGLTAALTRRKPDT